MSEKHSIIKDTSSYSVAMILSNVFTIISTIIVARLLGPTMFGILALLKVILVYNSYSHLGSLDAMEKEIPAQLGRNNRKKADSIRDTTLTFNLMITLIIAIGAFIASFLLKNTWSAPMTNGLLIIGAIVVFERIYVFFLFNFRANRRFDLASKITLFYAFATAIFAVILSYLYQVEGALIAVLLPYLFLFLYFLKYHYSAIRIRIDKEVIRPLMNIGLPLLILTGLFVTLRSVDKIMIAGLIDATNVGYYGIGNMMNNMVLLIPATIASVMLPRMSGLYGSTNNVKLLKKHLFIPTYLISYLCSFIVGSAYVLFPVFVKLILPEFTPGITAAKILLIGIFFICIINAANVFVISLNKQKNILLFYLIAIIINVVLGYILIKMGYGINGVSIATTLSYFIISILTLKFAIKHFNKKVKNVIKIFTKVYIPFIYTMIIVVALDLFRFSASLNQELIETIIKYAIFALFMIPLAYMANKQTGIIKEVIIFVRGYFAKSA